MTSRTDVKSPVVEFYSRAFDKKGTRDSLFGIERYKGGANFYMNTGLYEVPDEAIRKISVDELGIWHIRFAPEARYVGIRDEVVCINYPSHEQIRFDCSSVRSVRRRHDRKLLWQNIRERPKEYLAQQLRKKKKSA